MINASDCRAISLALIGSVHSELFLALEQTAPSDIFLSAGMMAEIETRSEDDF